MARAVGSLTTTVLVPVHTVSEANRREHWSAKARRARQQRAATSAAMRSVDRGWPLPCIVTLVRVSPRLLDDDNLRGALKACRDQVAVEVGLPVNKRGQADDRDPRVEWRYRQEQGGAGVKMVWVEIETGVAR